MSPEPTSLNLPAQILTLAALHLSVESLAQYLSTLPQHNPHTLTLEHLATPLGRKLFQSIALSSDFCEQENLYGLKLYSCLSEADNPEVLGDPFTRSLAELKTRYFFMVDPAFPWQGEAPTPEHYLLLRDKPSTFLAWIVRMSFIKRWALMHCFRDENVSEHSHQTAVIAHMLGVIHNELKVQPPVNPSDVALIALYHEVAESKVQDLNSNTKYLNPEFTRQFKAIEHQAEEECLRTLPPFMQKEFAALLIQSNIDHTLKDIVKAADHICAYIKTANELRFNNPEFVHVKDNLEATLQEAAQRLPEVDYFMRTFVPLCWATVDQLSGVDYQEQYRFDMKQAAQHANTSLPEQEIEPKPAATPQSKAPRS